MTGIKKLYGVFYLYLIAEFVLPPFPGEIVVDGIALGLLSGLLVGCVRMRTPRPILKILKAALFSASLVFLGFLAFYIYEHPNRLMEEPSSQWRGLVHGWTVVGLAIILLSSKTALRFISNLQSNPARFIVVVYSAFAIISSLALVLPVSTQPGVEISWLDALFTSVSAISGTGLVVLNTAEAFTFFGKFVILLVMQAGGIGIITFSGILLLVIGKELGLREKIIQDDSERMYFFGDLKAFTATVALVVICFESLGAILLYPWMLTQFESPWLAAFHSIFQSVSAFCTAGFTTLTDGMLAASGASLPLITIGALSIFGMLGLPSILNIARYLKPSEQYKKLGAYTKLEILMAGSLIAFGTISLFIVEMNNTEIYAGSMDRLLHSFFQSSMRNAGFNSVVIADMSLPAIFVLLGMMIVGGAPMSTAGGLKTSTIGVLLIFVVSFLRGTSEASFAKRRVPHVLLTKAVSLITFYFSVLFIGFVLLSITQPGDPISILFESISALSVTGFSLGLTPDLTPFGKSVVIVLMMVGRIGLLTAVYALILNRRRERFRYPQGDFYVG